MPKYLKYTILVIASCAVIAGMAWFGTKDSQIGLIGVQAQYSIYPTHPRIYFTSQDIPGLQSKIAAGGSHAAQYNALKAWADYGISHGYAGDIKRVIQGQAFLYALTNDTKYLDATKYYMNYYVTRGPTANVWQQVYDTISFATAFDWVYNGLTAAERQTYGAMLVQYADKNRANVGRKSDYVNMQPHAYMSPLLYAGLALYGEGINDAKAQEYLFGDTEPNEGAVHLLKEHLIPAREQVASEGSWWESISYARVSDLNYMAYAIEAWKVASNEDLYDNLGYLTNGVLDIIYHIRPHDGQLEHLSDQGTVGNPWIYAQFRRFTSLLASRFNDGRYQYIAQKQGYSTAAYSDITYENLYDILWYTPTISAQAPNNSWPLTQYFQDRGLIFMKTGFESANDTFATFKCSDLILGGGHDHMDAGSFTIHKYSSLAIDSGFYDGHDTNHYKNYLRHTVAHNSILVFNPSETFWEDKLGASNDGGQWAYYQTAPEWTRYPGPTPLAGSKWDVCNANLETTVDYNYIFADATKAYKSAKLSLFQREFVFLKPNYFVVFDRVNSTDANFQKSWLLHSINAPLIDQAGGWTTPPAGINNYDSSLVRIDNGGGRLFLKTLAPASRQIKVVGGSGYEFWVNGLNYPPSNPPAASEPGAWRIEVQPATAQQNDLFLNVLQTADSSVSQMTSVQLVDEGDWYGVVINDPALTYNKVVFSKTNPGVHQITSSSLPQPTPSIILTKTADKTQVSSGEEITYTITYQNTGTGGATNVVITDTIPDGTTYVVGSGTAGGTFDGTKLTWIIATLPAGASGTVSFRVKVE